MRQKALSLLLCIILCLGLFVPALAAYNDDVTVSASLDKAELNYDAAKDQTVILTVTLSKEVSLYSIHLEADLPSGLILSDLESGSEKVVYEEDDNYSLDTGIVSWYKSSNKAATNLVVLTVTVPAGTEAGTYKLGVKEIELATAGENNGDNWMEGGSAYATLTIKGSAPVVTYTVKFDANGGSGSMKAVTVNEGESYTLPECSFTAPEGQQFKAWSVGGKEYTAGAKITVTENTTVKAVWEDIPVVTYTVKFDANGGSGSMKAVTINEGESYTLPECSFTAPEGQQFKAWSVGGKEYTEGAKITVTENTTVKAVWEDIPVVTYTVKFDANGGSGSMKAVTVNEGESYTLPECSFTAPEGQQFKAWSVGGKEYTEGAKITVTENTTVKAVWEDIPVTYTVSFDANGGTGTMKDVSVTEGEEYTLPACGFTAPEGQEYKAWSIDGVEYQPNAVYAVAKDTLVVALWQDAVVESNDLVTVRFHLQGGKASGITDGAEVTYTKDQDGTALPNPTRSGFDFLGWYDRESGGTRYSKVSASLPADLYAHWSESQSYYPYPEIVPGGGSTDGDNTGKDEPKTEEPAVEVRGNTATVSPEVENGAAKAAVDEEPIDEALKNARTDNVTVKVDTEGAESVELTLTPEALQSIADADKDLHIETENGTVKLDADTVSELAGTGKDVQVSVTANPDGTFKVDVAVAGKSADVTVKTELPAIEDGQVLLAVMPDGSSEIVKKSVVEGDKVYAELPAGATVRVIDNAKEFSDVNDDDWFAGAVKFASSHELFQGVGNGEFAPKQTMTRAMLVTVLYRLEDEPETAAKLSFDDVAEDMWYTDAVAWAAAEGIVNGTGDGFDPNGNVTREQIATILYRYAQKVGMDVSAKGSMSGYGDGNEVSSWAQDAMAWAVKVGLFKGDENGNLNPGADATRAEVATLLERLIILMVK